MRDNNVWKPAILPEDRKLVTTKWVFRPKYDIHGVIVKYKARLVARGFEQVYKSFQLGFAVSPKIAVSTRLAPYYRPKQPVFI